MGSEETHIEIHGRRVTWGYSRKVQPAPYESEEVSLYVSDTVPDDEDNVLAWANSQSEDAYATIKAEVWAGLGLGFTFDERGIPHLDKPAPKRPIDTSPGAGPGSTASAPPPVQGQAQPQGRKKDQPSMAQVGYYAQFPGFCKECGAQGIESFYDNRQDVDGRIGQGRKIGPDFKCKNCGNGIFRPGSYDYNQALKSGNQTTLPPPPPEETPY